MPSRFHKPVLLVLAAGCIGVLAGCASVKPWQRKTLADYTMRGDRDPIGESIKDHIFFSREMASGGKGVGGGGCGCN
jgi:type IV pilus biogenesis protein CpaD/CtpE